MIGFQILAPNAADIATGFAMAMKLNASRAEFQNIVGVNPSAAEVTLITSKLLLTVYLFQAFAALEPKQPDPKKASY